MRGPPTQDVGGRGWPGEYPTRPRSKDRSGVEFEGRPPKSDQISKSGDLVPLGCDDAQITPFEIKSVRMAFRMFGRFGLPTRWGYRTKKSSR